VTRWRSTLAFAAKVGASALAAVLAVAITDMVATRVDPDLRPSRFDLLRGAQIFRSRCLVCHGDETWEGKEGNLGRLGPSLLKVGAAAATRKAGSSAVEYILESILEPAAFKAPAPTNNVTMPMFLTADLSDDDVRNLVAYVASLGSRADDEIAALAIERKALAVTQKLELRRDVMELGERIFREKCSGCHSVHNEPEYLVFAPAVFRVGYSADRRLEDAIMHSDPVGSGRYRFASVALADGSELVGRVLERTPEELVLLSMRPDDRGAIYRVKLADVRGDAEGRPMVADLSPAAMVVEVAATPTPKEVEALVALIRALN